MKKILSIVLVLLMAVIVTACSGSIEEEPEDTERKAEMPEIIEEELTSKGQEEGNMVSEPMIDQIDNLSMIRSYFLRINENQTLSELKEIAESCGFDAKSQYSGSELDVIGNGEIVKVEFRDNHVYEAWIQLSTNKWNVQFSPYGKAIKDGEMIDVQYYEVCFGNTLDDRNQRFELDQGQEAFKYADSLDPID